jgi:hypothetical protein
MAVNFGIGNGMVDGVAGQSLTLGLDAQFTAISGGFGYSYATNFAFSGIGFSLGASVDANLIKGLDFGASKSFCTTDAKIVRYSHALASTEINPYYYDGADTCRKIQKKGTAAIYVVIDRSIRHITADFWANWVKDKTYEILDDISMFSLESHPLDANARLAIDQATN